MRWKRMLVIAVACVLATSVVATFDWAPAGASRLGQTVPTRTPTSGPATSTPTATLEPATTLTATPVPVASSLPDPRPGTPALLPEAGGVTSPGGVLLITLGAVLLVGGGGVWFVRRRRSVE